MLKKAGLVILGATAGVMSLSGVAFAGEEPSGDGGGGGHHSSNNHDGDHRERDESCDKIAYSGGNKLVSADNLASNLDVSHLNILANDESEGSDCRGDKVAVSEGNALISANNLLANADLKHVNVLANDESEDD